MISTSENVMVTCQVLYRLVSYFLSDIYYNFLAKVSNFKINIKIRQVNIKI